MGCGPAQGRPLVRLLLQPDVPEADFALTELFDLQCDHTHCNPAFADTESGQRSQERGVCVDVVEVKHVVAEWWSVLVRRFRRRRTPGILAEEVEQRLQLGPIVTLEVARREDFAGQRREACEQELAALCSNRT